MAVVGQLNGSPERRFDLVNGMVGIGQKGVGVGQFPAEAVLLSLQQVQRYGTGVVGSKQRLAFISELPNPYLLPLPFVGCQLLLVSQFVDQGVLGQLEQLSAQADLQVVLGDQGFDDLDLPSLERAVGPLLVTAQAHEVGVDDAPTIPAVRDHEGAAAVAAEQRPLQVVVVNPFLLAVGLGRQHVLDTLPGVRVDERFVLAGVVDAGEANYSLVVRVAQDVVKLAHAEFLARRPLAGPASQPSSGEFAEQLADGPVAGGVGLEGPPDQVSPVGIDDDVADVDAVLLVEVAERRLAGRAAVLDLGQGLAPDLIAHVAGVVLVDSCQHAVQQPAGSGLVDAFGAGDQGTAGQFQGDGGLGVIEDVAGPAVELEDDDVVQVSLGADPFEQGLKAGALVRLGAGVGVEVLVEQVSAEVVGLPESGLPLRRQ